ncbi:hypothetical protein [Pelagicoccus sp. SDUM812003]|uniref:hypothetical protein n=1 Tax=Pelagicoccus sp. SDUM812003 TaxID=3041267 RepID=UPI00280F6CCC|nr:hypothetical protein [Pelagicoccus sp. SDUM812003]MDQ8202621.1 hypothetical protein [Pelagicoccus sp. SDUM812003]
MKLPFRTGPSWLPKLILAVVSPLAFLGTLELALRIADYGRDSRFFIADQQGPDGAYRTNPRFTELFFPASFGLKPFNFRLLKEKPAGEVRVFLIGESAAMGVPQAGFGMAPQLESILRQRFPGQVVQVYNLGITAINSHAILPIVKQAVRFDPDLLVFYMGNNEVVGPYGPSSVATERMPPLALVRASLWLKSTRIGQLLSNAMGAAAGRDRDWRGMEMFVQKSVAPDDPRLHATYRNFSANLSEMLELASQAGIPSVVSTVAVNHLDCAPFVPIETDGGRSADELFYEGRELTRSGRVEEGEQALRLALQYDALRFRADQRMNQIIREAAAGRSGVTLVDSAQALFPAGRESFFEHVHFTFEGNFRVARLLADAAGPLLFPGAGEAWDEASAEVVARDIGFSDLGRLEQWKVMNDLVTRPPFTGQSTYLEDRRYALETMDRLGERLAQGGVAKAANSVADALSSNPRAWLYLYQAKIELQRSRFQAALDALDRHDALAPEVAESMVVRAIVLAQSGKPERGLALLRSVVEKEPHYPQTYPLLASLWIAMGKASEGAADFAAWVESMPANRGIRLAYSQLLAAQGLVEEAAGQWEAVLQIVPDDERALLPYLQYLFQQNRSDEAIDRMLEAHAYNPRNFSNNDRLVQLYQQKGDKERTLEFMRDLMASGPVSEELEREYERLEAALAGGKAP